MNILFSPIGMTDPISKNRDGAMLHICRHYPIDKVYLYMSKEVCELDRDPEYARRYAEAVERLSKIKNHNITVEKIETDLVDVQKFSIFVAEFRKELNKIRAEYPDATLYLNVSSGTPSMKSALQELWAFYGDEKMIPIQVSTPAQSSNNKRPYDFENEWENNRDNKPDKEHAKDPDYKGRCCVSDNDAFAIEVQKKMLESLINRYDYVGAQTLAQNLKRFLTKKFIKLLAASAQRVTFSDPNAPFEFTKEQLTEMGVDMTAEMYKVEEYLRMLDIKVKKGEYTDFMRSTTPLIAWLFEEVLLKNNFDVTNYLKPNKQVSHWAMDTLRNKAPDVLTALNDKYFPEKFRGGLVSSDHLAVIIEVIIGKQHPHISEACNKIREAEDNVRNTVAHEVVYFSETTITNEAGMSPGEIVEKLREVLAFIDPAAKDKAFFDSYDKMNEILLTELKHQ